MELTKDRWRRQLYRLIGRSRQGADDETGTETIVLPGSVDLFDIDGHVARRVDAAARADGDLDDAAAPSTVSSDPLTVNERRARAAAVRALMRARDGHINHARALFAEAATLDPSLDLSTVPMFWELPRPGQDAAVEGYELAGRNEDAVLLASELAYTFRPKLVRRQTVAAPVSGD